MAGLIAIYVGLYHRFILAREFAFHDTLWNHHAFYAVLVEWLQAGYSIGWDPFSNGGQPLYLFGAQCAHVLGPVSQGGNGELQAGQSCPGGKALNRNAFVAPAKGQQGNLGRNGLRGFGATQWDFALHKDFPFRESLKLQFRAEMFNILNHPNFAPPVSNLSNKSQFGLSTQTLGDSLAGGYVGGGAFNPLYQIGGPRSMQLALKLSF